MKKRLLSGLLAFTIIVGSLSGCSGIRTHFVKDDEPEEVKIRVNEPMSADTKWVNSEIDGAIDESTPADCKNDFYTYVNKDWLLDTKVDEDKPIVRKVIDTNDDVLKANILSVLRNQDDPEADGDADVPEEILAHDKEVITQFARVAEDWEGREADSYSSLKRYIDKIENISTVEEMKNYILDTESQNLFALDLSPAMVMVMPKDAENYYVVVDHNMSLTFGDRSFYKGGGTSFIAIVEGIINMKERYGYVLKKMGYTDMQVNLMLKKCLEFEGTATDHMLSDGYIYNKWLQKEDILKGTSLEDIKAMEGNYPLAELMEVYGYNTDRILIDDPDYIKFLGKYINESNLEKIKAYFILHTVEQSTMLLDRESINDIKEIQEKNSNKSDETDESLPSFSDDDADQLLVNLANMYVPGCLNTVYISEYCRKDEKEDLSKLTEEIMVKFKDIIDTEEWLSDESKSLAKEKVDCMTRNILFPDKFRGHEYIDISNKTNLFDIVATLSMQNRGSDAYRLEGKTDRSEWNLEEMPTTVNNCFHKMDANSINILQGFISGGYYSVDMPVERKLAMLATVIGHEVTHGFDSHGCRYDKDGFQKKWWSNEDIGNYAIKVTKLNMFYSAITPYPGANNISGVTVSGEATADLGGMKIALSIAKDIDDFDYNLFFESYEDLWANKVTYDIEERIVTDAHPIMYLRGNIVVSQFDEFLETYGIEQGDAMYIAPDKRITVW